MKEIERNVYKSFPGKTRINISRKGTIVKEKCNQLMEIAWNLGYHHDIPDPDLTDLIKMYIDGNRDTIRDYKGYDGRVVHGRAGSHVIGIKRQGHVEIFGYAKRLSRGIWLLNHKLVPLPCHYIEKLKPSEAVKANNTYEESSKVNVEKISLSHIDLPILDRSIESVALA